MYVSCQVLVVCCWSVFVASTQSTLAGCSRDVGAVTAVDVSMVGKDGWFLKQLFIRDLLDDSTYSVNCSCWFDYGNDAIAGSKRMRRLPVNKYV